MLINVCGTPLWIVGGFSGGGSSGGIVTLWTLSVAVVPIRSLYWVTWQDAFRLEDLGASRQKRWRPAWCMCCTRHLQGNVQQCATPGVIGAVVITCAHAAQPLPQRHTWCQHAQGGGGGGPHCLAGTHPSRSRSRTRGRQGRLIKGTAAACSSRQKHMHTHTTCYAPRHGAPAPIRYWERQQQRMFTASEHIHHYMYSTSRRAIIKSHSPRSHARCIKHTCHTTLRTASTTACSTQQ